MCVLSWEKSKEIVLLLGMLVHFNITDIPQLCCNSLFGSQQYEIIYFCIIDLTESVCEYFKSFSAFSPWAILVSNSGKDQDRNTHVETHTSK